MTNWIITFIFINIYQVMKNKDDWRGQNIIKHAVTWQMTLSMMQSQKLFPSTVKKQEIKIGLC